MKKLLVILTMAAVVFSPLMTVNASAGSLKKHHKHHKHHHHHHKKPAA